MAKYSDIKGFTVQTLSTDTIASQIAGGSWASGGAMNTGRSAFGAAGTLTSALAASGQTSSGNNGTVNVEQYDGSSWTEVSNVNSARRAVAGSGASYTNSLIFGGLGPLPSSSPTSTLKTAITESWNGSTWTEVGDLTTAVYYAGPACQGTNTATLCFGGASPSGVANNQSWNGSSWTEVGDINTARAYIFGMGTSTAALAAGGFTTTNVAVNELWNGSSWTEVGDLNAPNYQGGSSGTSTASLVFGGGGGPGQAATTEAWDGSSWTEVADISEGNETIRGNGSGSSAAWAAGGSNPPFTTETQEWSAPSDFNQIQEGQLFFNSTANAFKETILDTPSGTWASGSSLNTTRWGMGSAARGTNGTNENALAFGGGTPGTPMAVTEEWNGSAWSEDSDLNTARKDTTGLGASYTSALCAGGNTGSRTAVTETWDGSSWTEVSDLNTARAGLAGTGTVTSGIIAGGSVPPSTGKTETWDGSSWTETTDLNTARATGAIAGDSATSALLADGADSKVVEQWDGTSWTEVAELNQERNDTYGGIGSVTSAMVAGGYSPAPISPVATVNVELWNGTSWTEINNLATGRASPGSQGSTSSAMVQGGYTAPGAGTGTTETFTAPLANKTITAS